MNNIKLRRRKVR